jgi:hypothetical protein
MTAKKKEKRQMTHIFHKKENPMLNLVFEVVNKHK